MFVEDIVLAAQGKCPAVGIADPHSLVGCVEFARACRRVGVKPLIGASVELPEGGEIALYARSKRGYIRCPASSRPVIWGNRGSFRWDLGRG